MVKSKFPSQSKVKTFTIQSIEEKACTGKKCLRTYHAIDENDNPRKIAAIVSHGLFAKNKSIKAVYEREALIVKCFANMQEQESVTIDFATDTVRKALRENERHVYRDAYSDAALMQSVEGFSGSLSFFLKVFTFLLIGLIFIYGLISLGEIFQNFKNN